MAVAYWSLKIIFQFEAFFKGLSCVTSKLIRQFGHRKENRELTFGALALFALKNG